MEQDDPKPSSFSKMYPSQLNKDDKYFMKLAYNKALAAWEKDEVPVGAIAVHKGQVIGAAFNQVESQKDPTAHAEILAITQAARALRDWRLNEVDLYVTKEPCPMCSGATIMARIRRVIYAFEDPKMGCLGGSFQLNELKNLNHRVEITKNVLEKDCKELIQAFFIEKRKPKITIKN